MREKLCRQRDSNQRPSDLFIFHLGPRVSVFLPPSIWLKRVPTRSQNSGGPRIESDLKKIEICPSNQYILCRDSHCLIAILWSLHYTTFDHYISWQFNMMYFILLSQWLSYPQMWLVLLLKYPLRLEIVNILFQNHARVTISWFSPRRKTSIEIKKLEWNRF